ncbi:MAG: sodium/proline symporter PutP [Clostridia bacterium]|nr:sodium/proline symporter PutP [Clostridia bacterium]
MTTQLAAFILYFVVVLGIGLFFFFKSKGSGEKDYFLGGRSMGPWVTALSAQASDMSGWLLMGFPGSILAFGMGQVWIGIGLALGTAANWIFVARRLRKFSQAANDSITVPQYLSNRFLTKSPALQIICAIVFLVFFTIYVASSFVAGQKVFIQVVPQLESNPNLALLIFAAIIIVYTFLGGFKAVCWTDFFQGLMMLAALLAVPFMLVFVQELDFSVFEAADGGVNPLNPFAASWQDIASGLAWGLGYFGMPHIIVRFMSTKNSKVLKKSATIGIVWVVLSLGAAIAMAILGRAFAPTQALVDAGQQELIFVTLAQKLFPGFVAGLLLSAIVAAAMSTADSQLLVASSSFTSDIYKPIFRKNASDKEILWVGRIVVLIIAVIAYFIASSKSEGAASIMTLVDNAWGGFGSAFGPVIILSLFWKRFTYKGAIAGVVGGAVVDVLWMNFLTESTGVYELLPGFIAGALCAVIVSLIDKKPSKEVEELFDLAVSSEIE